MKRNNFFDGCDTIEAAKKIYRKNAFELHPDQGGDEEAFKVFQNEYENFLQMFMTSNFRIWEEENEGRFAKGDPEVFAHILKQIFDLNIRVEIIGYWIYAFESFEVKEILKGLGFWFSKSKKAWVYSGGKKLRIRSRNTINDLRNMHGCTVVKEKEDRKKIKK